MMKKIGILLAVILFAAGSISSIVVADTSKARVRMQEHMEKMKRIKPAEYQKMFNEANGNIISCLSCHTNLVVKKKPSK